MLDIDGFTMTYIAIPLLIFLSRVADVTIGTLRIVFLSKGFKVLAPVLGFFEVLIWLLAMTKIFENLDNWFYFIAYAGGFAMGNYIGLIIEERIALGVVNIRIITQKSGVELIKNLSESGYGVTHLDAHGSKGPVHIIYCILKRKDVAEVTEIIKRFNPKAFYTLEDIRFTNSGVFRKRVLGQKNPIPIRKGK
ncbi:DUF2179 domain-containing protein [Carboxylicivirga sp. A043]|uniref:DUF2179 domain-containing protein n=1 Tax=Carboxylicivirga litoralis TaxID=2816963 RepID=UPI0021CB800E|nr:DUF2179 domain-containing protein [Carboxylicivirga sp. A043]MCU4155993.1 DUF2179 domain-containing protein [Carboxylicivirga sp. A043]